MKKSFTILIIALLAISCSSPQKRAEKIARTEVCKRLYYPNSYEPIETKVDSAYNTIYINEDILASIDKLNKYNDDINALESKLDWELIEQRSAKSSIALWSGPYMDEYGREERRNVIKHYTEEDFFKLNMNKEKIDDLIIELGLN